MKVKTLYERVKGAKAKSHTHHKHPTDLVFKDPAWIAEEVVEEYEDTEHLLFATHREFECARA